MEHIDQIRKILEVANVVGQVNPSDIDDVEVYNIDELVELSYFPENKTWEVGYWATIPGSYWEPEDVDYVKVHETTNIVEAVKYAITSLVDQRLKDVGYAIWPEPEYEF